MPSSAGSMPQLTAVLGCYIYFSLWSNWSPQNSFVGITFALYRAADLMSIVRIVIMLLLQCFSWTLGHAIVIN